MGYGDIEEMKDELSEHGYFFEKDIYCPYCFDKQDIDDIEEALEEGDDNAMHCQSCGKEFEFDTHVSTCYYIRQKED